MRTRLMLLTLMTIALSATASASAKTVWLCFPGHHPDPCAPGLSTTVYDQSLHEVGVTNPRIEKTGVDCFYVYPTVSQQPTGNSNLKIEPLERSIALYQAARYSQVCRVFAPMYRQVTLAGIGEGKPTTKPNPTMALQDVRDAFTDYLRHYNDGRGIVLIGHSQGSFVLRALMARDVDRVPSVRRRLVSAILLGGNVLVKRGQGIGGDFQHIPACRSEAQLGCVIAFSTFDAPPPADSLFGRAVQPGQQVLCTNPAALGGGAGLLDVISPSAPFAPGTLLAAGIGLLGVKFPTPPTVWWSSPQAYVARCASTGGVNVLEISPVYGEPTPHASPTPEWGLHLLDANVALGNLIDIVGAQARAWARVS